VWLVWCGRHGTPQHPHRQLQPANHQINMRVQKKKKQNEGGWGAPFCGPGAKLSCGAGFVLGEAPPWVVVHFVLDLGVMLASGIFDTQVNENPSLICAQKTKITSRTSCQPGVTTRVGGGLAGGEQDVRTVGQSTVADGSGFVQNAVAGAGRAAVVLSGE